MLLNCNSFLMRGPPLLACVLSNSLFWCYSSPVCFPSSLAYLTTASLLLYNLRGIAKY